MSLLHDMQISDDDLRRVPESLRTDITKKHSRIKMRELFQTWNIFKRDSERLNSVSERVHDDLLGTSKTSGSKKSLVESVMDVLGDGNKIIRGVSPFAAMMGVAAGGLGAIAIAGGTAWLLGAFDDKPNKPGTSVIDRDYKIKTSIIPPQ